MHPNVQKPRHLKYSHLPQIAFQSEEEKKLILKRGLSEQAQGKIPSDALERGEFYHSFIQFDYAPLCSIRWIGRKVGYGVFAEEQIPAESYVGEYTGIVRENIKIYFAPLNNYCYEYPIPDSIGRSHVIDATQGNFTRFINHSYQPNLQPLYAFVDGFYHLILISLRDIEKGEQLSYEYGPSYWYIRSAPQKL